MATLIDKFGMKKDRSIIRPTVSSQPMAHRRYRILDRDLRPYVPFVEPIAYEDADHVQVCIRGQEPAVEALARELEAEFLFEVSEDNYLQMLPCKH